MGNKMINEIKRFASELERLFKVNNITESDGVSVTVFPKYERITINYSKTLNHSRLYEEIPSNAYVIYNESTGNFIATWSSGNISFTAYLSKSTYSKWMEMIENMEDAKKGSL